MPAEFGVPWRERVLSVQISHPTGTIELHNTHVPPGASNGWTKIRHLEGLYRRLASPSMVPRLLVGDLNTPKYEHLDGAVETWADKRDKRWDQGERNVLVGLAEHELADVYRSIHGYTVAGFSIVMRGTARRYDHVFCSRSLRPVSAQYLHQHRESELSDHAPILVDFALIAPVPG